MDYSTICSWVYDLLKKDHTELPPDGLIKWADSAIAKVRSEWPTIPAVEDLSDADLAALNEAVGFLVAAKLRPYLTKEEPSGDLVRIHTQNTHFQYSDPGKPKRSIIEEWVESAYDAISRISVIADAVLAMRAVSLFQASGPRRAQEARGVNTHSINALWTILADEWDYQREHPQLWWLGGWTPFVP